MAESTLIDMSNKDEYLNDSLTVKRIKCLLLVIFTPIAHAIGVVLSLANRIVKLVTLSHFWHAYQENHYFFKTRVVAFCKDLLRVALTPIFFLGLELAALDGLMFPYSGGKIYATFERCLYQKYLLAPCFQPFPKKHLFGGDLQQPDNW